MDKDAVIFSGYARLPSGTVASELYKVMALVVLVEPEKGTILDAECTLSTRLSERFVRQILVGKSLKTDGAELSGVINKRYQGTAKKSILSALRIISDKYFAFVGGSGKHQPEQE